MRIDFLALLSAVFGGLPSHPTIPQDPTPQTPKSGYPAPEPCTGDCWGVDPALYQRKSDGKYFRFSTGPGIIIHSSNSLTGPWKDVGKAFEDGEHEDGWKSRHPNNGKIWAPDVHYEEDKKLYYMYYSMSKLGSKNSMIGVATSKDLTPGSWENHGGILYSVKESPYNAIDPNWVSIDGKPRLNFGSYWNGLFQVPLGGPLSLEKSAPAVQFAVNRTANHDIEAPFIFHQKGWYYLLFSAGRAGSYEIHLPKQGEEYRIVMCRSKSGTGNFVDRNGTACLQPETRPHAKIPMPGGSSLLTSHANIYGPGGQGVFEDKKHGLVLYYHYADKKKGLSRAFFQFGWNKLHIDDEGWPYLSKPVRPLEGGQH